MTAFGIIQFTDNPRPVLTRVVRGLSRNMILMLHLMQTRTQTRRVYTANSPYLHGKLAVFTRQIRRIYTANSPYLHGKLAEFAVLLSASGKTILPLAPIPLLYPYADTGGEPQAGLRYVAEVDIVLLVQEVVHLREYGVCRLAPRQSRVNQ